MRWRTAACAVVALWAVLPMLWQPAGAAFTAMSTSTGSSVATRSRFYPIAVSNSTPISYWRLGEAAGATTGVDTMGAAALTYSGGTLGVAGTVHNDTNTAYRMTATAHHATAATIAALSMTGAFTVQAWIRPTSLPQPSTSRVVAKYDGVTVNYLLAWDGTGTAMRILFDTTSTRYTAVTTWPSDGAWHLATGTYDGVNTLKLYLDTTLSSTVTTAGTIKTNAVAATIGITGSSMIGDVDEVAIWNRALGQVEVSDLYALATT